MLINQRIIWDNNGTLTDLSVNLNNLPSGTEVIPFVAAEDKIYIGSDLPFNHRYFDVSVVNAQASVATVKIWDNNAWTSAVDVIDQTDVSGATLAQDGIISWVTDRNETWGKEETTEDITELASLKIYDKYWVQISFSADLTAGTALQYIGHKFSEDEDLELFYPDLNQSSVKTAFKTGKTTWDEQHVKSAEDIVRHLRKKSALWSADQVYNWDVFTDAAIHRTAYWIMFGFGDDYQDERALAEKEYYKALNGINFQTDISENGRLDTEEKKTATGWRRR